MSLDYPSLVRGNLIKRYKRFLADVQLDSGETVTAHCPNTGAMTGMTDSDSPVWLLASNNPKRKLPWTFELVSTDTGMACVHSARANGLVGAALQEGLIPELANFERYRPEVKYGNGSRADFLLENGTDTVTVEVKAVTLHLGDGLGVFPDTVSDRARKHARELAGVVTQGQRAAMVFCVLHSGITRVAPAAEIDPAYAAALGDAIQAGVEVYALGTDISPSGIRVTGLLPFEFAKA